MIGHLERERILPIREFPSAKDVNSLGVIVDNDLVDNYTTLPRCYTIKWFAQQVADRLNKEVMQRGIHPGHCSVLYDHTVEEALFPSVQGGMPTFIVKVNESLRGLAVDTQASHVLQLSRESQETLLYSKRTDIVDTVLPDKTFISDLLTSSSDPEETMEYKMERHSEVI